MAGIRGGAGDGSERVPRRDVFPGLPRHAHAPPGGRASAPLVHTGLPGPAVGRSWGTVTGPAAGRRRARAARRIGTDASGIGGHDVAKGPLLGPEDGMTDIRDGTGDGGRPAPQSTDRRLWQFYREANEEPDSPLEALCPDERYSQAEEIGRGGMKVIRRVYDETTNRWIALASPHGQPWIRSRTIHRFAPSPDMYLLAARKRIVTRPSRIRNSSGRRHVGQYTCEYEANGHRLPPKRSSDEDRPHRR